MTIPRSIAPGTSSPVGASKTARSARVFGKICGIEQADRIEDDWFDFQRTMSFFVTTDFCLIQCEGLLLGSSIDFQVAAVSLSHPLSLLC